MDGSLKNSEEEQRFLFGFEELPLGSSFLRMHINKETLTQRHTYTQNVSPATAFSMGLLSQSQRFYETILSFNRCKKSRFMHNRQVG